MKTQDIAEILDTNPQVWTVSFQGDNSIVFAWGDYRFTKLSDRFGGIMLLKSKLGLVDIDWTPENPMVADFYSSLVAEHSLKAA